MTARWNAVGELEDAITELTCQSGLPDDVVIGVLDRIRASFAGYKPQAVAAETRNG